MEEVLVCAKGQCPVLLQSKFGELKPLEFYLSAWRTCSTIIFPHSTNQIVHFWRRRCCCRRAFLSSLLCFHARTCVSNFCIYKRDKISSKLLPCRVYKLRPLETKLRLALVQPCLKCVCTASEVRVNRVKTHCGCCLGTVWTRFRRFLPASKLSVDRSNHVHLELRIVFIWWRPKGWNFIRGIRPIVFSFHIPTILPGGIVSFKSICFEFVFG